MDRERITRYVRPEDVPLLDRAILEPILARVGKDLAGAYPDRTVEAWIDEVQRALIRGDLLIVIDDNRKQVGIVRTDEPPFSGIVNPPPRGFGGVEAVDPLNLRQWESGAAPPGRPDDDTTSRN